MSYRALLFCPDEKAARTVTQILGELEFTVEPCLEPFAAVKKLMGEHFDAVVVDCDNEQNATLLFKSARNSTSNQASLAVAVVEGQAGVAKAFRIGANLVLTKPINIEQSKGTLRVARGLLRKGEPVKPGAAVAAPPAPNPAKPAAVKPVATAKPAAPTVAAIPRPAVPPARPAVKPAPAPAVHSVPAVHSPAAQSVDLPEINLENSVAPPAAQAPAAAAPAPKLSTPAPAPTFGSGAASAPAPAREAQETHVVATPAAPAKEAEALFEQPAEAAAESSSSTAPTTSFTFGGTNAPEKSSGGSKKILLAVAAVVIVAAGLYAGWTYYQGRTTPSGSFESRIAGPAATPTTTAKPAAAPGPAVSTPATSTPSSASTQSAVGSPEAAAPAQKSATDSPDITLSTSESSDSEPSARPSTSTRPASVAKSGPAPLVVKGGEIPVVHSKPVTPDAAAPSMIGIATPGSSAPPPNLVGAGDEPKPVLQTLHISQGVSQGLLIKKVQPVYPRNALTMHMEGAVELTATISKTGAITAVKVISGEQLLTKAAVDAVKQWKYKPYLLNGEPVEIQTQVTINFKLPN